MTKAEAEALKGIDPRMKDQAAMVWRIEKAFRRKAKSILPTFEEQAVAQTVTNTQGEQVLKSNPAMGEIRATLKDYIFIVKTQFDLLGGKEVQPAEVTKIDALRQKLKIAK